MIDDSLRMEILRLLGLEGQPQPLQDEVIEQIHYIAESRLIMTVPQMLSNEQLHDAERVFADNITSERLIHWLDANVPKFRELVRAVVLDVTKNVAPNL